MDAHQAPPSSFPLLTSDRPIIMTNGISEPGGHVALPIGPKTLFIASNRQDIVKDVAGRKPEELVAFVNDRVVKQAREFVLGIDGRQLRFVQNRFGARLPSSPTETKRLPTPEEFAATERRR
ncbi:MAG TPA: DUF4238 domain-containing protein [Roseiarcus sp.]|jgi:hypothetical protein